MCLLISLSSGIVSGWYFTKYHSKQIVVIDVEKIVNRRKVEFTQKYSTRDTTNYEAKQEMSNDIKSFSDKLQDILAIEAKNKIILAKGTIVSDAPDITNNVESKIWK